MERRAAQLTLGEPAPTHEPAYRLHLWVAALRPERASWLVEKATEIGACSIRFMATERTPRKYGTASLERLRRVAVAAAEQSHRSLLPEISGVDPWEAVTSRLAEEPAVSADRFVLDTGVEDQGSWSARQSSGVVLVGPEGGWSPDEVADLERLGCRRVSLGERTLRVETAAIAASTLLLCQCP